MLADAGFSMRVMEAEYAFRLGRDLPPSATPYTAESVADAVASVHPAIEIVDSAFSAWLAVGVESLIADNGAHGAFILGAGVEDWRGLDLVNGLVTVVIAGGATVEARAPTCWATPCARSPGSPTRSRRRAA